MKNLHVWFVAACIAVVVAGAVLKSSRDLTEEEVKASVERALREARGHPRAVEQAEYIRRLGRLRSDEIRRARSYEEMDAYSPGRVLMGMARGLPGYGISRSIDRYSTALARGTSQQMAAWNHGRRTDDARADHARIVHEIAWEKLAPAERAGARIHAAEFCRRVGQ